MFLIVIILRGELTNLPHCEYISWDDYLRSIYGPAFSTWERYKCLPNNAIARAEAVADRSAQ